MIRFSQVAAAAPDTDTGDIVGLFERSFTTSEGAREGALIGALVKDMLATTPKDDLYAFTARLAARDGDRLVGGCLFSRLSYAQDPRSVFLLSPMAVATEQQGRGIGQALIRHGLEVLRGTGVDLVLTYGDPAFYGKVGFAPLTVEQAPPPWPLSQPEGWIGQSLNTRALDPPKGPSRCVAALDDPAYW